ncbi:LysM domain-containing protein [Tessaracoccus bendigoensis DSM 12906]|uniref:LysM domain-containing protein n=1 Tax=Tessaracoccus bendigoensis DSM 12906 TaxID=1123357 RepID=A0A1M6HF25_9ACTN|nr:tetratricopeptide repeat protein [Tessaracoccus bendigoensis]SHJ20744.1 LysM domain-containing protein [Tessaracoccus bendigoensis DSM 12906]
MTRLLSSLAAISAIAGILIGAPALLIQLGQLPGFLPRLDRLAGMLLAPDSGRFLLVLIWAAAWTLWAWLTVLILIETAALLRGVKAPRLPAASMPQGLARALVVAAAAAFIATPLNAGAAQPDTASAPVAAVPAAVALPSQDPRPTPPPDVAPAESVTVDEGDTLWDLAEEHLGDPGRWPELYDANKGTPQPTGHVLEDPDQIDVGWTLTLPGQPARATTEPAPQTQTQPETPRREAVTSLLPAEDTAPVETPAAATPSTAPSVTPSATPSAAAPSAAAPTAISSAAPATLTPLRAEATAVDIAEDSDRVDAPMYAWEVAGLLGAGTFLGVGISTLLGARRREQFRTRRPGRMIATPDPVVAPIEQTAQLATSLSGLLVARLDQVLRRLDPHTTLTAVVVARDATIVVHTPDQLPAPWIHDRDGWLLPNTAPVETVGDLVPDRPCPYPLLVTIGADTSDRVVLLNLEHAGLVTVSGDPVMSADFTRYLAAELAINPWSDGVRIACEGPATQVIGMFPERLDAHLDEILTIATTNAARAANNAVQASEGRAVQAGDETWAAAAVITGKPSEDLEELAALIANHPHQTGTALLTLTPTGGDLALTPAGRIRGLGFELTAVGLTEDEAAGCADLLAAATRDDTPPAPADQLVDVTGNLLPEHRADRNNDDTDTVESLLPEPDHAYIDTAAVTSDDLITVAPRVPEPVAEALQERDPDLDAQVRAWFSAHCPYPRLSLLGPVTARCHGKPLAKQKAYYTEALAYLALHPHGVTGDQVAEALGITVERARTVISTLRLWLGTNPATGTPHLPDAKSSPQAKARGVGLYLVEDLLVDADLFRRLRARGLARGREGIEDLETALQLVTGRPFDQLRPAGWAWLIDGDRVDHHMVCAVTDVAHILVTHHLQSGDLDAAKHAATIALTADPDSETARLDLAGIMVHDGRTTSARRILADALGDNADLDLTPRASDILNGKNWLKTG